MDNLQPPHHCSFPSYGRIRAHSDPYRPEEIKPPTPPDIEDPKSFIRLSLQAIFEQLAEFSKKLDELSDKLERVEKSQNALGIVISHSQIESD